MSNNLQVETHYSLFSSYNNKQFETAVFEKKKGILNLKHV